MFNKFLCYLLNNFDNVITNICVLGNILGSLSKCYVSMNKSKKKFFKKIVQDLEIFTFTLFINLLLMIVPEDSSGRLSGFFSKKRRIPTFAVSEEKKFKNPQPTLRNF